MGPNTAITADKPPSSFTGNPIKLNSRIAG
jgi:hypothetical protein